jgi:hypothetical protein
MLYHPITVLLLVLAGLILAIIALTTGPLWLGIIAIAPIIASYVIEPPRWLKRRA